MSTRAIYTFADKEGEYTQGPFHVYAHSDGYPTGAAEKLIKALAYAWPLPRYEADEFAAAFVAANKSHYANEELRILRELEALGRSQAFDKVKPKAETIQKLMIDLDRCRDYASKGYSGGGVRLMPSGDWKDVAPQDLAYRYEIQPSPKCKQTHLLVTAYEVNCDWEINVWTERKLFVAPLKSGATLKAKAATFEGEA